MFLLSELLRQRAYFYPHPYPLTMRDKIWVLLLPSTTRTSVHLNLDYFNGCITPTYMPRCKCPRSRCLWWLATTWLPPVGIPEFNPARDWCAWDLIPLEILYLYRAWFDCFANPSKSHKHPQDDCGRNRNYKCTEIAVAVRVPHRCPSTCVTT